jgi:hypothetical protein
MVNFLNPLFLSFSLIAAPSTLPRCVNDQKTLDKIEKIQKENAKNSHRYDGYREALSEANDVELFTRLAYAETLAANCTSQNAEVSSLIVNVIGNRVIQRNRDIKSVVFERAQFASSLHNYSNSRFKDFLCPQDETLWLDIRKKVDAFLKAGSGPLSADTVNYFLYQHDPRWTKEPWNLKENATSATGSARNCIRTFRNASWK